MRILFIVTLVLLNHILFGQDLNKKIKKIKTIDQANTFIKENPTFNAEIIEFNSSVDSSEIAINIFGRKLQNVVTIDGYIYKIIESKSALTLRASYIYLNGDKLSFNQIDSLRKIIISKYNNNISFPDLAKEYNMDNNSSCDLGWFSEEMMVKEFSTAVKEHKKGEIFIIDIPSRKWYYVTLKTFDNREVNIYTVLKIKSST